MAKQTITTLIDDLDGGEADESVDFGLDGISYEIDLNAANAQDLREVLDKYVQNGRSTGGRRPLNSSSAAKTSGKRTRKDGSRPMTSDDRAALQRFAEARGYKVPAARGRVSRELVLQWEEAGSPV